MLATIAGRTSRILLGTAVSVLSTDDPVRVFERFATLDALSEGRAEVTLGRGSFTESFPLFGHSLEDYERLFEEKLALFVELRRERPLHWEGTVRPPLTGQCAFPTTERGALPTWVGVGGPIGRAVVTLLSRKTDYALLILSLLSREQAGASAHKIADQFGLSRAFTANILKELCQKGFVASHRGDKGGYALQRPADVVEHVEAARLDRLALEVALEVLG